MRNIFRKNVSKKDKRELILRAAMVLIIGVLLFISIEESVAWFTHETATEAGGARVSLHHDEYELLVARSTEFDRQEGSPAEPVYPGVAEFKDELTDLDYSLTYTSTGSGKALAFELHNEKAVDGKYSLLPGSYGTLTFYVKPSAATGAVPSAFSLELLGFSNSYDHEDNLVIQEVTNTTILNYLKGHILFFTGRTGATGSAYQYNGLIEDGTFPFTTTGRTPASAAGELNGCYEVTLYWEWVETYNEIRNNVSTTSPAVTKRFPAEVGEFFEDHRDYFLAKNHYSTDVTALNDGYNDADQLIGIYVNYFVAQIADQ